MVLNKDERIFVREIMGAIEGEFNKNIPQKIKKMLYRKIITSFLDYKKRSSIKHFTEFLSKALASQEMGNFLKACSSESSFSVFSDS